MEGLNSAGFFQEQVKINKLSNNPFGNNGSTVGASNNNSTFSGFNNVNLQGSSTSSGLSFSQNNQSSGTVFKSMQGSVQRTTVKINSQSTQTKDVDYEKMSEGIKKSVESFGKNITGIVGNVLTAVSKSKTAKAGSASQPGSTSQLGSTGKIGSANASSELKNKKTDLSTKINKLETSKTLAAECENLSSKIPSLQKDLEDAQAKFNKFDNYVKEGEGMLKSKSSIESKLEELKAKDPSDPQIKTLEAQLAKLEGIEAKVEQAKIIRNDLETVKTVAENNLNNAKTELEQKTAQIGGETVASLEQQIEKTKEELKEVETQIEDQKEIEEQAKTDEVEQTPENSETKDAKEANDANNEVSIKDKYQSLMDGIKNGTTTIDDLKAVKAECDEKAESLKGARGSQIPYIMMSRNIEAKIKEMEAGTSENVSETNGANDANNEVSIQDKYKSLMAGIENGTTTIDDLKAIKAECDEKAESLKGARGSQIPYIAMSRNIEAKIKEMESGSSETVSETNGAKETKETKDSTPTDETSSNDNDRSAFDNKVTTYLKNVKHPVLLNAAKEEFDKILQEYQDGHDGKMPDDSAMERLINKFENSFGNINDIPLTNIDSDDFVEYHQKEVNSKLDTASIDELKQMYQDISNDIREVSHNSEAADGKGSIKMRNLAELNTLKTKINNKIAEKSKTENEPVSIPTEKQETESISTPTEKTTVETPSYQNLQASLDKVMDLSSIDSTYLKVAIKSDFEEFCDDFKADNGREPSLQELEAHKQEILNDFKVGSLSDIRDTDIEMDVKTTANYFEERFNKMVKDNASPEDFKALAQTIVNEKARFLESDKDEYLQYEERFDKVLSDSMNKLRKG